MKIHELTPEQFLARFLLCVGAAFFILHAGLGLAGQAKGESRARARKLDGNQRTED